MKINKETIALFLIKLIIIMPIYSSIAIAQPAPQQVFITAEVPEYISERTVNIEGDVTDNAVVQLLIDGNLVRTLGSSETADGRFEIYNIVIGDHGAAKTLRLTARDTVTGSTAQQEYTVTVDKQDPKLTVVEFKDVASEKDLKIEGSVDEESTISIYAEREEADKTKPAKITGLTKTSALQNSIQFEWDKSNESDFDRYVIYREDVGAIATTFPANYNSYTDLLVDSNETYDYEVAAMDFAGNIGIKSDKLTVTTPFGGRTGTEKPDEIDPEGERGLKQAFTANGNFSVNLDLGEDGRYKIKVEAVDPAGNKKSIEKSIIVDTEPPTITQLNPLSGTNIYENFAKDFDLEGKTKAYAKVKIYVNSKKEREDFSTIADANGRFRFDDIDITSYYTGRGPELVGVGELDTRYTAVEERTGRHARTITLYMVVEDLFGRTANMTLLYHITSCWEGEFDWNAMPLLTYQSPSWLSVERLSEGTESIYFMFNFTYIGDGREAKIDSINFQRACDDFIKEDPRYNISCDVMPASCTARGNDDNTLQYVACDLSQYNGFQDFLEDDWEDFFESINNEMIFPFKITIRYHHIKGNNRTVAYQSFCKPVTYVVDSSKIDFREVLPEWMLYDLVEDLNSTVTTLNEWQDQIENILEYLGIGCMAAWGLRSIAVIYRRFTCFWEGFQETTKKMFEKDKEEGKIEDEEEKACPAQEKLRNALSDKHLERDCKQCAGAWKFESNLYKLYRGLCDRVFCHTAPARWTQDKDDSQLFKSASLEVNKCSDDDRGLKGQTLIATPCSSWPEGSLEDSIIKENGAGDECYKAFARVGQSTKSRVFVKVKDSEYKNTGIYKFISVSREAVGAALTERVEVYAKQVKGSLKESYYTANTKSCEEICGTGDKVEAKCIPSDQCLALDGPKESPEKQKAISALNLPTKKGDTIIGYSSKRSGYTRDCTFGNGKTDPDERNLMDEIPDTNFVGDNAKDTKECCCVYQSETKDSDYYRIGDYGIEKGEGKELIKWSYRYDKINFATGPDSNEDGKPDNKEHNAYNPNRYVGDRDWYGCFGQNYWLDQKGGQTLTLDPFKDHLATFECLCVSGIHNRLTVLSNILTAMQNCLVTVRTTGTADTGVCKELFSQYVCSFVWQIISFLETGCLPWGGKGIDLSKSEDSILNAVRGGTSAIFGGLAESASDLASEYGNAQLNNLIGAGEGAIVRKICMAAFGFDWEFDVEDIMDAAYATPLASLVHAVTKSREYLTYDPVDGQSKYEYRASWIINPGCDMDDYDVYLSCVTRNELDKNPGINCDAVGDPEGVNCDCLNYLNEEKTRLFYDGRGLTQNVLEDIDHHDIITSPYRYDHLKFVLKPDQDTPARMREKCFPDGFEDGVFYFPINDKTASDVFSCYVDVTTGTFNCLVGMPFFKNKGTGYFVDMKINDQPADDVKSLQINEDLVLIPKVWKAEGPDLCMYYEWTRPGGRKETNVYPIDMPGLQEYPPLVIEDDIEITGLRIYDATPNTVDKGKLLPDPLHLHRDAKFAPGETMYVKFYDNDGNGISISRESKDEVEILGQQKAVIGESNYWSDNDFVLKKGGMAFDLDSVIMPTGTDSSSKEITFEIRAVEADTASRQATKELRVYLVHLKGDNSTRYLGPQSCNINDKVKYQNKVQEKTYRITIGTKTENMCAYGGTEGLRNPCRCSGIDVDDCATTASPEFKYCYANQGKPARSCHAWPKCADGMIQGNLEIACDCDVDGLINDNQNLNTIKTLSKTCEGTGARYCYDSDGDGTRQCNDAPQAGAPAADTEKAYYFNNAWHKDEPTTTGVSYEERTIDRPNKKVTVERYDKGNRFLSMEFSDTDEKEVEYAFVLGGSEWWGPEAKRSDDKIKTTLITDWAKANKEQAIGGNPNATGYIIPSEAYVMITAKLGGLPERNSGESFAAYKTRVMEELNKKTPKFDNDRQTELFYVLNNKPLKKPWESIDAYKTRIGVS